MGKDSRASRRPGRTRAQVASLAILGMALLVAAAGLRAHVMPGRGLSAPVELQAAVGAVGPGSQLTLQTAAGPMKLTVDSQMNQAGYVHAYGYANGQMYAGFVQLAAQNAAAQQALALAPTNGQAQLAQYPPADPYSQQTAYAAAVQQWGGPQQQQQRLADAGTASAAQAAPAGSLQLHIGAHGGLTLNGEHVVPSNRKTAAILRLLARRVEAQRAGLAGRPIIRDWHAPRSEVTSKLDAEISHAKRLVSKLETVRAERGDASRSMLAARRSVRRRHERSRGGEPRAAIWAAMQSLMHSVDKIEKKQDKMAKVVKKVSKVMRFDPFTVSKR